MIDGYFFDANAGATPLGQKAENGEEVMGDISYVAHPVEVHAAHLTLAFTLVLMIWSFTNLLQAVASGGC